MVFPNVVIDWTTKLIHKTLNNEKITAIRMTKNLIFLSQFLLCWNMNTKHDKLRFWQYRIFIVTWLGYAGFYFCRKNFSVTMPMIIEDLGYSKYDMAMVLTAYSTIYMLGQFISGYSSDRWGPRIIVSIGLLIAVLANFAMGVAGSLLALTFLMSTNGLGQSTGWSGLVKNMTPWIQAKQRGVVMSWWSTCYVIGAFAATVFATYCATSQTFMPDLGWRRAYFIPALVLLGIAIVYMTMTRNLPEKVGLQLADSELSPQEKELKRLNQKELRKILLGKRELWIASFIYLVLKLTRYVFLFWLPLYLAEGLHYSSSEAGYLSSVYELIGFIGVIAAGYFSDYLFQSRRFPIACIMLFLMAGLFYIQPMIANMGMTIVAINIGLIGIMTYGPDSILCAAAAMDIGGKSGAAMTAGIINGIGSIGQIFSGFVAAIVTEKLGWDALFYGFVFLSLIAALLALSQWNFGGINPTIRGIKDQTS